MRWCVVGGGMLGLTIAHRVAQAGHDVTIIEAAPEIGGLAAAWQVGDVRWDRHYHVTLLSDSALRSVLDELGLDEDIRWVTTKTGFYADGRLSPMSNAIEYLKLPALSLMDKARLGSTILWGSRVRNWRELEQTSVEAWLTRLSGARVFDRVWRPLLRAKLGDSYKDASAAFIWATIQRLYAARRSGLKEERFGYVPGGYARVLDRFAQVLQDEGVEVETGIGVIDIDRALTVRTTDGHSRSFDRVVVTANPPVAAKVCGALTSDERARLGAIRYQGVVCASLVLRVPLAPYYLTYITDADVPFTAVVEMTAFVDADQTAGRNLVYLPLYLDPADPRFELSDDELRASFWPSLKRMYPHLQDDDLLAFQVSRVRHVFPIPTLGYSEGVPPVRTSVSGLHLVSSANIVNGTLNVNETVMLAERTARDLLGQAPDDTRAVASLSLDLDNQWSYMKTHGDPGWEEHPTYLDVVVPRVLSLLEERDLRITFFVVGADADRAENEHAIGALARAGHEIGNHSYRHEPWLHLYDSLELDEELTKAEIAIERVTGQRPVGFRGPGYSLSEDTLRTLVARGYRYDASTLPTVVGPLARAFYFRTAKLDSEQRRERSGLFGQFKDGLRPLRPYRWRVGSGREITELPVTTMPIARIPIHVSYLVFLARLSPRLARAYFRLALAMCRRRRVEVSILLHPLDFLGADDVGALGFFPGMEMPTDRKIAVATDAIDELARQFRVVPMLEHVEQIERKGGLPEVAASRANPSRPA